MGQACPVVSHHSLRRGWGQICLGITEDIQDRSQGDSVVPEGVLQGYRVSRRGWILSVGLTLAVFCIKLENDCHN